GALMRPGAGDSCLTILHFNDFHGKFEADENAKGPAGGAARLVSVLRKAEKESAKRGCDTYVLFGGDAYSGSLISSEFKGKAERRFLNFAGVDAMVLGNHDFDYGLAGVKALVKESSFPVISANVYLDTGPSLLLPTAVLGPKGASAVVLLGLTSAETPLLTSAKNVDGLVFKDPIDEAKRREDEMKWMAPIKIALTHMGVAADEKLAGEVKTFDAVIGGHDHVFSENYCRLIGKTPVCQTPAYGKYVGEVRFAIGPSGAKFEGSRLIPVDASVPEDPAVAAMVKEYADAIKRKFDSVVGEASADIKRLREDRPHAMGVLVADSFREAGKAYAGLIINGAVRANIAKGPVRLKDAAAVLPFESQVVVLSLTGAALLKVLAHGVKRAGASFPQVAGITFDVVGDLPKNVKVKGKPINLKAKYKLAVDDFVADGGEGFDMLKGLPRKDTGIITRDALAGYIEKRKVISPPKVD
nr:5'-nucleotidase C-terminal domain-containing protein [bacterium]